MIVKRNGILKQTIDTSGLIDSMPQHPIVQVRLYTAHSIISGTLRLGYSRLSDHLNFGPPVLELGQAELINLGHETIHRAQQSAYVRKDSVLLAIDRLSADYAGSNPALREERRPLAVAADLGHVVVTGALHLAHGADLHDWLLDSRSFAPLTDATIHGDGAQPRREPSAIINRAALIAILH